MDSEEENSPTLTSRSLNGTSESAIYVEIQLKRNSTMPKAQVKAEVEKLFEELNVHPNNGFPSCIDCSHVKQLREHVQQIEITCDETNDYSNKCDIFKLRNEGGNVRFCIYHLNYDEPASESLDDGNSDLAAATHWVLPSSLLHGLWESLIYDTNIKSQLLNFASTAILFSDKNVDSSIITWNRVVLLHGPPGTGKTSLCKALAQKLSIRFNSRYSYGQLIEINSHSLFSKWFSESGKLVMKMFDKIQEFIDDPQALVFVLIDEVESLAHARKVVLAGNEPSDAIRVVNAILTQLDNIKKYSNVLILTTSNITGAIDLALVDRADIKHYIGLPSPRAIFKIYETCTKELIRTEIVQPETQTTWNDNSHRLIDIAEKSKGLSGRTLRKLPFLAHALFLQKNSVTLSEFLDALSKTVDKQFEEINELNCHH